MSTKSSNNSSNQPKTLSVWSVDVAENTRTWGALPGDLQPEACVGCSSTDRMSISRLADNRKYWVCDACGSVHESEESQSTAHGVRAYANKFRAGDFVRTSGSWVVYRVDSAHRSDVRDGGFFKGTNVTGGAKYHVVGKQIFVHASYYIRVEDPQGFVEGHGYKFEPNTGK